MKQIYSCAGVLVAAAALLTVGLTGRAEAGTATSAPFYATGTDEVSCTGINTGTMDLDYLTVAIVDDTGLMALNSCMHVKPGVSCSTMVAAPKGGFCGLIFKGSPKHVRGSISIVDMNGNVKAALPAN